MIDEPVKLLEFIEDCLRPKDHEKKEFSEVFTPMKWIDKMLDKLPKDVWTNEKLTWYDPANGMGNFPIAIYLRLMIGLKEVIKNKEKRKKHILEKMLYMCELNSKNVFMCRNILDAGNNYKLNIYCGDALTIDTKTTFRIHKFDIIIGNPPYNGLQTRAAAKPIYNEFIQKYIDKCTHLMFIIPSRWFAGGRGLDKFREMMLSRKDIRFIRHYDDAREVFGTTVSIEGGINYFLKDAKYKGSCDYNGSLIKLSNYDILVDSKYYNIINHISKYKSITEIYKSQDHHHIQTNDKRLVAKNSDSNTKCYVSKQKGFVKYIPTKCLSDTYNYWKVITAEANGKSKCFGNIFIGNRKEVHTKSYISFRVHNEKEAKSLESYLKCRLVNLMLSIRKISQHISSSTCKWIPLPPLDRIWTDADVYKYYKLSKTQIEFIRNTEITGYKPIKTIKEINDIKSDNKKSKGSLSGGKHE